MYQFPGNNTAVVYDSRHNRWLLFKEPRAIFVAHRSGEVVPALGVIETKVQEDGFWAVGFISYEASPSFDSALAARPLETFPLLWFGIYGEPEEIPPAVFEGRTHHHPMDWEPSLGQDEYKSFIRRIKEYIQAGDTYQVNYTFRLRTPFYSDPWPLFVQIIRAQGRTYGAFVNTPDWTICSASPELFFRLEGRELVSRPMKGTMPRGLWCEHDSAKAAKLRGSDKERAENVMIVDMVRSDMGRIGDVGSVQVISLFDVEQYATVWQMTSTVRCTTNARLTEIFRALFPPASITGAPKRRTMQIIAELESTPRGIYTGSIGFIAPHRQAQFNVAIRTVLVDKRNSIAEYGVGGGIVWDSAVTSEFQECSSKALILTQPRPEFSLLETLLWTPESAFFLLDRHLARLENSAHFFSYPVDMDEIRRMLIASAAALPAYPHKVRLVVSKEGSPALDIQPLGQERQVPRICLARKPVDSSNPFLYHKTTYRETYEHAKRDCPGYEDVLLWNEKGEITESCIANVVVEMNGEWFTPPIHCGLLPGTYRSLLLEEGKVKERTIHVDELGACSKIFLVNSVRGKWKARLSPRPEEMEKKVEESAPAGAVEWRR